VKSLFNEKDNQEIIRRFNNLTTNSKPDWGKMEVSQMVQHCTLSLKACLGEIKPKRAFTGILFGKMIKKKILSSDFLRKNTPTSKEYVVKENLNLDDVKLTLISYIRKFVESGREAVTKETHPFFGKMTVGEWDILMCKHLDHHLMQFGV